MADAYRTKGDLTISSPIGEDGDSEVAESVSYPAGSYVLAENLTKRDRERAANGELDHLLEPVDAREAEEALQNSADDDFAVFVPEHEAEAHALEVYGHTVVPPEQALELGSASGKYAAAYQDAVREHGLDRRPIQEHFAQERERVPDEVLTGAQHRSGLPFERGPVGFENVESDQGTPERSEEVGRGQQQVAAEVATAPRQRPGSSAQSSGPQVSEEAERGGQERTGESTVTQSSPAQEVNPTQPTNPAPAQSQASDSGSQQGTSGQ